MNKKKIISAHLCLLIFVNVLYCFVTLLSYHPSETSFHERLAIDSQSYYNSASEMIKKGNYIFPPDQYHNAATQVLFSWILRNTGENPLYIKIILFILWMTTLLISYYLARIILQNETQALFVTTLFSFSNQIQKFTAITQYEIIVLFLFSLSVLLFLRAKSAKDYLIAGFLFNSILLFQRYYVIAIIFADLQLYFQYRKSTTEKKERKKMFISFVAPTLIAATLLTFFHFYYNIQNNAFHNWFYFRSDFAPKGYNYSTETKTFTLPEIISKYTDFLLTTKIKLPNKWLSSHAPGYNFPYPRNPEGFKLISDSPLQYFSLVGRHLVFLHGLDRDLWYVDPFPIQLVSNTVLSSPTCSFYHTKNINERWCEIADFVGPAWLITLWGSLGLLFLISGLISFLKNVNYRYFFLGIILTIHLPHLLVGGSTRFLIPFGVLLALIKCKGIFNIFSFIKNKISKKEGSLLSQTDI